MYFHNLPHDFKTICFTLLLPIVFAAINRSLLTGVSFAVCFIAMTTGYTLSLIHIFYVSENVIPEVQPLYK